MRRFVGPMIGMITLLVGLVILGNFVPLTVEHPSYDQGCSCMNGGIAVYVDDTDVFLQGGVSFYKSVGSGESFGVLVRTEESGGVVPAIMTWMPDTDDNGKFKFDPQEVKDNSPNDKNPDNGAITAQFSVTAPEEPGSYLTGLSIQRGTIISMLFEVKSNLPATTTTSATSTSMTATTTTSRSMTIDTSPLTEEEKYWLSFMREEEKLARDVYLYLGDKWDSQILRDISASEQRHMDLLKPLLDNHGVPDPVGDPGVFAHSDLQKLYNELTVQGSVSLVEALKVGALVEQKDIDDLKQGIATANHEDIKTVYGELTKGSSIHLNAFQLELSKYSTTTSIQQTTSQLATTTSVQQTTSSGMFTTGNIIVIIVVLAIVALVAVFLLRRRK